MSDKCIILGCTNHKLQGRFIGNLCGPCHDMLVSGEPKFGQTFVHEMRERVEVLEVALRAVLKIPNSEAAQGIMKAFAEDALGDANED